MAKKNERHPFRDRAEGEATPFVGTAGEKISAAPLLFIGEGV